MEVLSPLDAAFLRLEDRSPRDFNTRLVVAGVDLDKQVERTRLRPLASGRVSLAAAWARIRSTRSAR